MTPKEFIEQHGGIKEAILFTVSNNSMEGLDLLLRFGKEEKDGEGMEYFLFSLVTNRFLHEVSHEFFTKLVTQDGLKPKEKLGELQTIVDEKCYELLKILYNTWEGEEKSKEALIQGIYGYLLREGDLEGFETLEGHIPLPKEITADAARVYNEEILRFVLPRASDLTGVLQAATGSAVLFRDENAEDALVTEMRNAITGYQDDRLLGYLLIYDRENGEEIWENETREQVVERVLHHTVRMPDEEVKPIPLDYVIGFQTWPESDVLEAKGMAHLYGHKDILRRLGGPIPGWTPPVLSINNYSYSPNGNYFWFFFNCSSVSTSEDAAELKHEAVVVSRIKSMIDRLGIPVRTMGANAWEVSDYDKPKLEAYLANNNIIPLSIAPLLEQVTEEESGKIREITSFCILEEKLEKVVYSVVFNPDNFDMNSMLTSYAQSRVDQIFVNLGLQYRRKSTNCFSIPSRYAFEIQEVLKAAGYQEIQPKGKFGADIKYAQLKGE